MEELTTKELIEEEIRKCVDGLKNVQKGSDEHGRLVADIQKLTAAWTDLDKTEQSKIDSDRRFKEEIRQKDLDRDYRDILERDKMNSEKEMEKEKIKESRKSSWRDVGIKFLGIVIPTGLYFLFMSLGMKLEYIDHGSVTSMTTKELLRGIKSLKL